MIFNHKPIQFEELETVTINGKRHYVTPEGKKYPSITSVLSILSKQSIMEWRKRVGEEEANKISTKAARRGTKIHAMCEDYLNNELDEKKFMPSEREMFSTLRPILDKNINNIYAQEIPLYSDYLKVAGRVDCIAEFNGVLSVIDFKTSKRLKNKENISNYFQQTAAYAVMFEERTKIPVSQIVVIIAVDDEEEPQVFVEKRDNYIWHCIDTISLYNGDRSNEISN